MSYEADWSSIRDSDEEEEAAEEEPFAADILKTGPKRSFIISVTDKSYFLNLCWSTI